MFSTCLPQPGVREEEEPSETVSHFPFLGSAVLGGVCIVGVKGINDDISLFF